MFGGVRDRDHGDDVGVVGKMRDGQTRGESGDAATPGAADFLLGAAHLGEADGAERVAAVEELGAPARAVVVEADLAFQRGVLGKSLHGGLGRWKLMK